MSRHIATALFNCQKDILLREVYAMRRRKGSSELFARGAAIAACLLTVLAALAPSDRCRAADAFQTLVNQIPRSANAVVLLNMEKAKNSPLGLKEDWKGNVDKAFQSGLIRVPPQATRFVLAAQMDFEEKEPLWEAAVMDLDENVSMPQIEQSRSGTPDTIEGLPALARPNDTYLVQLGPKTLGGMGPGNRQAVVRWIREVRKMSPPPLSPYLQKAAVYSDDAGSEIIMALDLEGVLSRERVGKYLKAHQDQLDQWHAKLSDLAQLLSNVHGIRIGVRIGEEPSGMVAVDLHSDASDIAPFAKPLLLQVLADMGALIKDFESWDAQVKGNEIQLAGKLSISGLRRLLSVVNSPVSENALAKVPSQSDLPAEQATKSREYFRTIRAMANDLKDDMGNAKNLASTQIYFDKYARRIERMPILGVDPDLLQYSAFVSNTLRQATGSIKTMGIQSGVRQAQTGGDGGYYGGGYRYGAYGGYGSFDLYGDVKAVDAQRRVVRAEEKATAATNIQALRQNLIDQTNAMRRKMTEKYQIEF